MIEWAILGGRTGLFGLCVLGRVVPRQRVAAPPPGVEASGKRSNSYAVLSEEERHPGTRRFVGSSTVEHGLAVSRDLLMPRVEVLHRYVDGPRDSLVLRREIQRVSQINDVYLLTRVELLLEVFW